MHGRYYHTNAQGVGKSHPEGAEDGRRERLQIMQTSNPAFVLRAETMEQAIKAAENGGERAYTEREVYSKTGVVQDIY